jgi:ribosomal protein S18 acetylase RimI-like enzyme
MTNQGPFPTIRLGTPGDETGIARVHVASWQSSYRGLVPDHLLDNLSTERSAAFWGGQLEQDNQEIIFVAEDDGDIIGFASGGPFRPEQAPADFPPHYDCEIYAIYLLQEYKRQGTGTRLFQSLVAALAERGFESMMLWVLADNLAARRFYENLSGVEVGEKTERFGDRHVVETAYGWEFLRKA